MASDRPLKQNPNVLLTNVHTHKVTECNMRI